MRKIAAFLTALCILVIFPTVTSAAGQRQKVILDTDLGSDLDDAFALALVLTSPEFEVLGITMDHGLTQKRAQIACRMLYEVGMENIPVAVGRQTPLQIGKDKELDRYWMQYHWGDGFTKVKPIETPAADFIIQMLRKYPHEVILFTIGPVPNIGDVIRKDPEALKLAKHIYAMYGSFYRGYDSKGMLTPSAPGLRNEWTVMPVPSAEYNVAMDVESSKLFSASGAQITYAPLDITTFIVMDEKDQQKIWMRHSPLTDALSGLYALWSTDFDDLFGNATWVIYDCVAIGMALWPDLFTTRPAHVRVIDGGFTVIDESKPPNCEIGVAIKKDLFLKRVLQRWVYQNLGRE
jgi:inosine-uridine nucleoside N-ribohydrolase